MNILLIEDETRVASFIARGLKADGFVVTEANTGEQGLEFLKTQAFDVVILDLMLPGISGYDVCRQMRARENFTPVLMLSAMDEPADRVQGLNVGADDFMNKPFEFDELVARLHALHRRANQYQTHSSSDSNLIVSGHIQYDQAAFTVTVHDKTIDLTDKERDMLVLFLSNPNRVLARERILNSVWGANTDPLTNVVDVYIGRLRKKLALSKDTLKTLRGVGYRYSPEDDTPTDNHPD